MRIETNQSKNQGSVLLVTLCTAWVIGIALVSYLTLVANQNRTTYHSQSWSGCIPVLEAGIEEALTQLNYNNGEGVTNATSHGWTSMTNGCYFKTNSVGPAIEGSYYEVTIDPNTAGTPATPIIISKGYVPAPGDTGTPMGMILGTFSVQSTPAMISRTVQVRTRVQSSQAAPGGLIAKNQITMSTGPLGSVLVDSFDSSDPRLTNGIYAPAFQKAGAKALSNLGTANAISVNGGHIYGSVTTGTPAPGVETVSVGNTGAVGDADWNLTGVTGTGPARIQSDPVNHKTTGTNLQFDDVAAPFDPATTGFTPVNGTNNGTAYNWVVDGQLNNNWKLPTLSINNGQKMIVTGNATLYVTGGVFTIAGTGYISVAPGASLKIYVGSATASVSGGGIINGSGRASNFSLYGLPTNTNFTINGAGTFTGTVYAPNAQLTVAGTQATGIARVFGSLSGKSINMTGGAQVHYDESLNGGSSGEYIASTWNEI